MKNTPDSIQDYISAIPSDRTDAFEKLRQTILQNTFNLVEEISYGMIGYVVPHDIF